MKKDRFLIGIMVFIAVLVIAAIVLLVTRGTGQSYQTGDSPEAIVYNFTLAVTRADYDRAYSYLAEGSQKPSPAVFRSHFLQYDPLQNVGLRVGAADLIEGEAVVEVTLVYGSGGPFDTGYSTNDNALLVAVLLGRNAHA